MKAFRLSAVLAAVILLVFSSTLSAAVIGRMVTSSGSEQVRVYTNQIDWTPAGPPTGTFVVSNNPGTSDDLRYGPGSALIVPDATVGTIMDVTLGAGPVPNFMVLPQGITFNLAQFDPGTSDTDCSDDVNVGDTCSPFGSVFILQRLATGTGVTLTGRGTVTDTSGDPASNFIGSFSVTLTELFIPGRGLVSAPTPADIQQFYVDNPTSFIESSHAGDFSVAIVAIPEPATMALMGCGLVLIGLVSRRIRK